MLIIRNAVSFDTGRPVDVFLHHGRIHAVGERLPAEPGAEELDARGLTLSPGLVDMHVHLRDPGQTHKGDILTETAAAAAGGVTGVACMPNTTPAVDCVETLEYIRTRAQAASAHVYPIAAISAGLGGGELTDMDALAAAGARGFSDDGRPVESDDMMAAAMKTAARLGVPIISHCEDMEFARGGLVNTGAAARLGVPAMHPQAETNMVRRDIALSERLSVPVHIAHVSAKESVEAIREAKKRGVRVTAETCPHYCALTEALTLSRDADYRMNPPLRTQADVEAVIAGLQDDTIDILVTDHAPHAPAEKADFAAAPNGVVGLETSFAACLTHLVRPGHLTLSRLVHKMSFLPAALLHVPPVELTPGCEADLMLFDPDFSWTVDPARLRSKSRNTPYKGMTLTGKVMLTLLGGKIVYRDAAF